MFTGIIEEIGTVKNVSHGARSAVISIAATAILEGTKIGDSIAVNGVCLTVSGLSSDAFTADVMPETMQHSTLGTLRANSPVNLERALRLSDRLGGHIVSGHIDGIGRIAAIVRDDNAVRLAIEADASILRYIVEKGSVALDGISLTVTDVSSRRFGVSVIPHTFANTDLSAKRVSDLLNIECDIIGKYVEKLAASESSTSNTDGAGASGMTMEFLAKNGF